MLQEDRERILAAGVQVGKRRKSAGKDAGIAGKTDRIQVELRRISGGLHEVENVQCQGVLAAVLGDGAEIERNELLCVPAESDGSA